MQQVPSNSLFSFSPPVSFSALWLVSYTASLCLDSHLFPAFGVPACIADVSPGTALLPLQLHLLKAGLFWGQTIRLFLFVHLFFFWIDKCLYFTLAPERQVHEGTQVPAGSWFTFQPSDTIVPPCDLRRSDIDHSLVAQLFALSDCFKALLSSMFGNFTTKCSDMSFPWFNQHGSFWAFWIREVISFINSRKVRSHLSFWKWLPNQEREKSIE